MAYLDLNAPYSHQIDFFVTGLTPAFVNSAAVELYDVSRSMSAPVQTHYFHASDIAGVEFFSGVFFGVEAGRTYRVWVYVVRWDGEETSRLNAEITLPPEWSGTMNTAIHSVNFLMPSSTLYSVRQAGTGFNTFDTWCLVPIEVPTVSMPPLKSKYVDLPASDGQLDYTELLLGNIPFGRRTGSWRFYVDLKKMERANWTWDQLYASLVQRLNGQEVLAILNDDPAYYYEGRLEIKSWKTRKETSEITIDYNFASYKYSFAASSDVDWQWDALIEDPDYTILYGRYAVADIKTLNLINNGDQTVTPTITTDADVYVTANIGVLVQEVIRGEWGFGDDRAARLRAAGYSYEIVQNAVNEALGNSARLDVPSGAWDSTMQALQAAGHLDTGTTYQLVAGENVNENLALTPGDNTIVMKGDANLEVTYRTENGL